MTPSDTFVPPQRFHFGIETSAEIARSVIFEKPRRDAFCCFLAEDSARDPSRNFFRHMNYLKIFEAISDLSNLSFLGETVSEYFLYPNERVKWLKDSEKTLSNVEKEALLLGLKRKFEGHKDSLFLLCVIGHLAEFRRSSFFVSREPSASFWTADQTPQSSQMGSESSSEQSTSSKLSEVALNFSKHIESLASPDVPSELFTALENMASAFGVLRTVIDRLGFLYTVCRANPFGLNMVLLCMNEKFSQQFGYRLTVPESLDTSIFTDEENSGVRDACNKAVLATGSLKVFYPVKHAQGYSIPDTPAAVVGLRDGKKFITYYLMVSSELGPQLNIYELMLISDLIDICRRGSILD